MPFSRPLIDRCCVEHPIILIIFAKATWRSNVLESLVYPAAVTACLRVRSSPFHAPITPKFKQQKNKKQAKGLTLASDISQSFTKKTRLAHCNESRQQSARVQSILLLLDADDDAAWLLSPWVTLLAIYLGYWQADRPTLTESPLLLRVKKNAWICIRRLHCLPFATPLCHKWNENEKLVELVPAIFP